MGPEVYAVRKVIYLFERCGINHDLIGIIRFGIIHLETLPIGNPFIRPINPQHPRTLNTYPDQTDR